MSLFGHVLVLGFLVVDLIVGATVVREFLGRWPATGFEFLRILGYVLFVLQSIPRGQQDDGE